MTDIAGDWKGLLDYLQDRYVREKGGFHPPDLMYQAYQDLGADERLEVDELMTQWLLSDDDLESFAAMALVQKAKIRSAIPALRELADRMEMSTRVGFHDWWDHVNLILGQLAEVESADPGSEPET